MWLEDEKLISIHFSLQSRSNQSRVSISPCKAEAINQECTWCIPWVCRSDDGQTPQSGPQILLGSSSSCHLRLISRAAQAEAEMMPPTQPHHLHDIDETSLENSPPQRQIYQYCQMLWHTDPRDILCKYWRKCFVCDRNHFKQHPCLHSGWVGSSCGKAHDVVLSAECSDRLRFF